MFFGCIPPVDTGGIFLMADDAFFYQYTHEMGFFEYLSWRYQTWVGRMSGEAMVYIAFSLGIWFWRIVNAMMLVLLPCGVLKLAEKAAGIRTKNFLPGESVAVVSGYLLMAIMTVGYAAIWINGSIFIHGHLPVGSGHWFRLQILYLTREMVVQGIIIPGIFFIPFPAQFSQVCRSNRWRRCL